VVKDTTAKRDAQNPTISVEHAISSMSAAWSPVDLCEANGNVVRLAKLDGAFHWHHHLEDELFICWKGTFRIELGSGGSVTLREGEMYVVPKGIEHRPVSDKPAYTLTFERKETKQHGN
jgi:mannose-6-phosphate isomerase-like protein (cupin superfamily)